MASLRDIRSRIGSVENTKQVTGAMRMVAAAKLRRAQERIFAARPHTYRLREITHHLQEKTDTTAHPLFEEREEVRRVLVILVTADRGLAGAFNSNAIKLAERTIEERYAEQNRRGDLAVLAIGQKGRDHFQRRDYPLEGDFSGAFDDLSFETARKAANRAIDGFREERFDEVRLVYNEFKNTISQNRISEPLLPLPREPFLTPMMEEEGDFSTNGRAEEGTSGRTDYIFEPSAEGILETLVPHHVRMQVWRAMLESNAAEQGARMVAMENATNNAEDLLEDLRLEYNRARQDAITTEIIEITSGAQALEES
ncbi:MAG: ATP synthase F1 subunit gamma [Bacteroidetes bacterium QS_9_68_14]|nr:MAG: ATP synthase F1 subunit gamma [Bacteroidetes bacterium QS_9_68_14]